MGSVKMLLNIDKKGTGTTRWKCDRCGRVIPDEKSRRMKVDIKTLSSVKSGHYDILRTYDLCNTCSTMLCRGIERGVQKGKNNGGEKK